MKKTLLAVLAFTVACSTAPRAKPPRSTVELPPLTFAALRDTPVAVHVVDRRERMDHSEDWIRRTTEDVSSALQSAGVTVSDNAPATLEVRLETLGADFELNSWNACAKISSELTRENSSVAASGDRCVKKWNFVGVKTADEAMGMAYQDVLTTMLKSLDSQLR